MSNASDPTTVLPQLCRWQLSWTVSAAGLAAAASNWSEGDDGGDGPSAGSPQRQLFAASLLHVSALVLGLPLNALALFVFCRCSLRRLWTTLLLETTCLVSIAALFLEGVPELVTLIGGDRLDLAQLSPGLCRGLTFAQRLARAGVACLVVCLAEDRVTSLGARHCLRKAHTSARNITRRHVGVLLLVLLLLVAAHALLPVWYRLGPATPSRAPRCALPELRALPSQYAFLLQLLVVSLAPLAFHAAFLVALAVHLAARTDCHRAPPPADHWANKLAGSALMLYAVLNLPRLVLDLLLLATRALFTAAACPDHVALRHLLEAVGQLYAALTPLLYTACSRFRRELLFTTCCSRYAMTVQPRDSVMVQNRC